MDGCESKPVARGLCSNDYQRIKTQGRLDEVAPKVHGPCQRCGGVIPLERRFGAKFCSKSCKDDEMDARKHEAVVHRRATRRTNCAWCEQAIEQKTITQRFCSRKCGDAWSNEQVRLRTLRAKKAVDRPCAECDEQISPNRPINALYCSPECKTLAQRISNPTRRKTTIAYNRMYLYGVTPDRFAEMLAEQGGSCGICPAAEPGGKGAWHVDHDHATGRVRGLLCHHCNLGLGNFKDEPSRLRAAITYLEAHAS
jgi:predicted nucleic acid-binding Zn ribbon protein